MSLRKLAYVLFAVAFLIALEQYVSWGEWFTIGQLHHETFVVTFAFAGMLLLYLNQRRVSK